MISHVRIVSIYMYIAVGVKNLAYSVHCVSHTCKFILGSERETTVYFCADIRTYTGSKKKIFCLR